MRQIATLKRELRWETGPLNTSLEAAPRRELLLPGDQGLERHGVGGEVDRPAAAEAPLVQPARDLVRHHLAAVGVHEEGERGGADRGGPDD